MVWSVPIVDTPTFRASLACISRIDECDGDASTQRLIAQEGAELAERPVRQAVAMFAAGRNPSADMRQFFQRKAASGAFSIDHKCLRYAVVCMLLEPRLFAGEFDEPPLGGLGATALQPLAALVQFGTDALNGGASVNLAVARGGNRDNPEVNPNPVGRFELIGFRDVAGASQYPLAAHKTEIGLALAEGKQITLFLTGDKVQLHSAFERPDRNCVVAFEAQDALVIWLGSVGAEDGSNLAINLEGVGDLGNATDGGLSGQFKVDASAGVVRLVQVELPEGIGCKALGGNSRTGFVAALQRRLQDGGLFAGRQEFDSGNEFHSSYIDDFAAVARPAIPPPFENGGFSREKRQ